MCRLRYARNYHSTLDTESRSQGLHQRLAVKKTISVFNMKLNIYILRSLKSNTLDAHPTQWAMLFPISLSQLYALSNPFECVW